MQIDILRPDSTLENATWTLVGGASAQAILSDNSDASYVQAVGTQRLDLDYPDHTPAALHQRHRVQNRVRLRNETAPGGQLSVRSGGLVRGATSNIPSAIVERTFSDWFTQPNLATPGPVNLVRSGTVGQQFTAFGVPAETLRIMEAYFYVDTRHQPSFSPDVLNAAGGSEDGSTITDTPRADLVFGPIDYDDLAPRFWSIRVLTSGGFAAYEVSGIGAPPASILTPPLPNGAYTAEFQVESTIRVNDPFQSAVETVSWTQSFTPPVAPVVTVTENGCLSDAPHVEICWTEPTPGAVEFDDINDVVIEIERTDCRGTQTILMQGDSPEGCWCDRFVQLTDDPYSCVDQDQALVIPGISHARTPDSAGLSIPDNIDIMWRGALVRWFDTFDEQTLASKRHGGNDWHFRVSQFTGRLQFVWWLAGAAQTETADADVPFEDGEVGWVRVRRSGTSVTFYSSQDDTTDYTEVTWTQLGTVQTTSAGSIDNVSTFITLGSQSTAGGEQMAGRIEAFTLLNNVTPVASPVFAASPWRLGDGALVTNVDAQGNVWTIASNGAFIGGDVCLSSYKARYWGLVDTILVSTDWSGWDVVYIDNPTPGNGWLRGAVEGDLNVCPDNGYGLVRPFGASQPIEGGIPTVITGTPGGRDYALSIPVTSEHDQRLLEAILAQTLVFYQPVGADDLWLAPRSTSVTVVKVGRIRQTSVDFVAVNPQPQPDPDSFL